MTDAPLVSIALCTYNGEKHLAEQMNSILSQTYRNLEIVIVDDCSTDNTFTILNSYAQKDSRIKLLKNETNLGFNKNFERAISLTTGNYIAISDQDDIWLPEKIESLLAGIGDNWLIFSNSSYISGDVNMQGKTLLDNFNFKTPGYKSTMLANFITGHTTLFKREFIPWFLPFPQKGFYDWWMSFVATYHQKIAFLDKVLTQYRIHDESVMQQRLNSGNEKQEENKAISDMLTAFEGYKNLEAADKTFIGQLKKAYDQNLSGESNIPLIKLIIKYYDELFVYQKNRRKLSLLNFALKYCRKAKNKA